MDQISLMKNSIVLLTGIVVYQTITIRRLSKAYVRGYTKFEDLRSGTLYLLNFLEENNIDLDEFDVIALNAIIQGDS